MAYPGPCGTTCERYEIVRRLGGGGFGNVYLARHTVVGREVALKLLGPRARHDAEAVQRLLREARAANAIGSPHIVAVHDGGVLPDGRPFLVMDLVKGEELASVIEREGPIAPDRAVAIALQVLEALDAAHARGIVHRDIKPSNVMLAASGSGGPPQVKVLDFGISRIAEPEDGVALTQTGMMMGTPGYAAPEQYASARDVDARCDLYAVGVLLHEMLTGRLPHQASSYEQMVLRVCGEDPPPIRSVAPHVGEALAHVVDRALQRAPSARWASANEMAAALRGTAGPGDEAAHAATMAASPSAGAAAAPSKRLAESAPSLGSAPRRGWIGPILGAATALLAVAAVAGAWWWAARDDDGPAGEPIAMAANDPAPPPDDEAPAMAVAAPEAAERADASERADAGTGVSDASTVEAPADPEPAARRRSAKRPQRPRTRPGTLRLMSMTAPAHTGGTSVVRQRVEPHAPALARCHQPHYVAGERMTTSWWLRVNAEGAVTQITPRDIWWVRDARGESPPAALVACVVPILRGITFGPPRNPDDAESEAPLKLGFSYSAPGP